MTWCTGISLSMSSERIVTLFCFRLFCGSFAECGGADILLAATEGQLVRSVCINGNPWRFEHTHARFV
jgi:hypothetical protein